MSLCRHLLITVVLLGVGIADEAAAQDAARVAGTQALAAASGAPVLDGQAHEAIDNAVAGTLVNAISEQLGGRAVDMKLDALDIRALNASDRTVSGTGSLRIQGDQDWMGFRFQLLYDSLLDSTSNPQVSIGGVAASEHDMPNDVQLLQQLDAQVSGALGRDFHQPSVRLQLDRIRTVEAGSRYLRIDADGIADFGRGGSADTQIEALYDRHSGQWLRVHYEMGNGAERSSRDDPFVKR